MTNIIIKMWSGWCGRNVGMVIAQTTNSPSDWQIQRDAQRNFQPCPDVLRKKVIRPKEKVTRVFRTGEFDNLL